MAVVLSDVLLKAVPDSFMRVGEPFIGRGAIVHRAYWVTYS